MDNNTVVSEAAQALLAPWCGPCGGLPPLEGVTPAALEEALHAALAAKRAELRAIADNPAPPTFGNTCEALEDAGRALSRVLCVYRVCTASLSLGDMPGVAQRTAPLLSALDDEMAHDERLLARINAVWQGAADLAPEQRRLVEVQRQGMRRRGAGLAAAAKARLAQINARLAALSSQYQQNLIAEAGTQAVFIEEEGGLDGLTAAQRDAAAAAAAALGRAGIWAIPNARGAVWPFLTQARRRDLREQVWRMWTNRGDHEGALDNKPLAAEILQLRGELARLMGSASFAHHALADRMARTPETVMSLLHRTWASVKPVALRQLADYQAMADRDGLGDRLQPWDRQFYAEQLRRERFGVDGEAIRAYLPLEGVLQAMFWAAGRVHGLAFRCMEEGVQRVHPTVRVYEVSRAGQPCGVLYFDLLNRPGKMHGSYQFVYRDAEHFKGRVLPVCSINSSFPPPQPGQPVLLPWEYANVFFHEFGHALHMLHNATAYPSLASQRVAWDFVELPALINERWLRERELLARFARHHVTGQPMPDALIDRIEQAMAYERIFSLNPDYLIPAIVDMRLHLLADGSGKPIDPVQIENDTLAELGMPPAWDQVMRVTHNVHVFAGSYAAGLYAYLWADVMAADAAEVFERSPGGLFDGDVARAWIGQILSVGHGVPADGAFRAFAGHDPDPLPLQRRFGLPERADSADRAAAT
jgi:peptidyl-dipeptidase Dcp